MTISINSTSPHRRTFNRRLTKAGLSLAVFATSLLLIACPSPGGGGGTTASDGGKPTPKEWHVTTFAGSDEKGGTDGTGTSASFTWLYSIAQSGATFYVTDASRHSIRTIDTTTARVDTIVSNGGNGETGGYANGNGTTARFNGPSGIVAADAGTLYVADSNNHRIRKVTIGAAAAATQVDDFAGRGTAGHANGAGTTAQFRNPAGLAIHGTTLYVADYSNHRIRAIDLASRTVSDVAGSGTAGHANGAGTTAQFRNPTDLAIRGTTLYVSDYSNHRIRAIDLASANKTVSTIAGDGTAGYADGAGITAQFNGPHGITVSGNTLYVSDSSNHRIRAIDLASGAVRNIAGDGMWESRDGIGTAARFKTPTGIIAVSENTLYVATKEGQRIRKLEYR